jgi:DNA-binding beta-propeller fold protein YncE
MNAMSKSLLLGLAGLSLGGRAIAGTTDSAHPTWPPPPAAPRGRPEAGIAAPADFGVRVGFWGGLGGWLSGNHPERRRFVKPFGVFADERRNLCLTDVGTGSVYYFDRAAKSFKCWDRIGKTRFLSPVAVVKKAAIFFVADTALQRVVAFDDRGRLHFEIAQSLRRPCGLALSGETLLVADALLHRVLVFDLDGHLLSQFGTRGAGPGELNYPTHVAVDSKGASRAYAQGRIYVTDSMNARIQVFDALGRFRAAIGSPGDSSGHFARPKGIAVDAFDRLYAVDAGFDNVQVFDASGRLLLDWGGNGAGPGEFWLPAGIAIDRDNRIFVADTYNRRVQVFRYVGPD